ncbi:unnamed protein product [Alopecurus aequalis]
MEPPPASVLPPASATPAPAQQPPVPSQAQVASVVAATHVGAKRRRDGQHVVPPQPAVAPAPASFLAPPELAPPHPPTTKCRRATLPLGPKGGAAAKLAAGGTPFVKRTTSRKKTAPAPPIADPPPVVHEVLDGMPATTTSFMGLLQDAEVDLGAPPLEPFGFGDDLEEEGDEEEEAEDEEAVTEIEEEAFAAVARPVVRTTNYSEAMWGWMQAPVPIKPVEHMMKSRETLTMKTLETNLLITKKKKEVKLPQVEARHEEAKSKAEERGRKADLAERMIKVKEAKTWKELMVEEKEHIMMSNTDMDEDRLIWWKDYKEDIAERKRIFRGASSTLRGDTPMSGGGDGGLEDSTTGAYGGA